MFGSRKVGNINISLNNSKSNIKFNSNNYETDNNFDEINYDNYTDYEVSVSNKNTITSRIVDTLTEASILSYVGARVSIESGDSNLDRLLKLTGNTELNSTVGHSIMNAFKLLAMRVQAFYYSDFLSRLESDLIQLGELAQYVPQGLCTVGEYRLVSLYDHEKSDHPEVKVIAPDGSERIVSLNLPNTTHVGGISYDPKYNKIWITGDNGYVGVYDYNSIMNNDGSIVSPINSFDAGLTNENGTHVASYITCYNGRVYVGSFYRGGNGTVEEFIVTPSGEDIVLNKTFSVPENIQGISFTNIDGVEYMALSQSFGRDKDSKIIIYTYENGNYVPYKEIVCPPLLEQINFTPAGKIECVFESPAKEYDDATVIIPNICTIDPF